MLSHRFFSMSSASGGHGVFPRPDVDAGDAAKRLAANGSAGRRGDAPAASPPPPARGSRKHESIRGASVYVKSRRTAACHRDGPTRRTTTGAAPPPRALLAAPPPRPDA
jgi:hypothetical protein